MQEHQVQRWIKKSFSFDMIPSGLIDRILINKAASPELPGDFAGGMVRIYTMAMPEKTSFFVNYQASYRNGTTNNSFNQTQSYKKRLVRQRSKSP